MNWIEELRHDILTLPSTSTVLKKFGITIGAIMILFCVISLWKQWMGLEVTIAGLTIGAILIGLAFARPLTLRLFHKSWMLIAIILGSIISRIVLLIVFFFIVTPVALAARLAGKKFFSSYRDVHSSTYWIKRDTSKKINYEQMF